MWSTFTAGLQMVQEKLMEGEGEENSQQEKLNEPVDSPDFGRQQELPNMTPDLASATIDTPSSTFTQQPMSPTKPHPQAHTPPPLLAENPDTKQPSPSPAVIDSSNELISLRQALQAAEEQTQLINDEYRKLLKGKEKEILSLKQELAGAGREVSEAGQREAGDQASTSVEILQKEVLVHKEMVAELRTQLAEKEEEFQELNSKAETKFNKLKAQAKTKIANLNRELDKLKSERGAETSFNISSVSLDDSISSVPSPATEALQAQLDSMKKEMSSKDEVMVSLQEKLVALEEGRVRSQQELSAMKDKLNVSEVRLQKEQENRVKLELQVAELEEQVDRQTSDLSTAREDQERLKTDLFQEKESKQILLSQVEDLTKKLETQEEPVKRNFSFTSSEVQVISGGVSQADSDEEWKVLPSGSSAEKSEEGSPNLMSTGTKETPVFMAGGRGSVIDMESEISRLETALRERDDQLSSFKTILEEKESLLQQQVVKETTLTSDLTDASELKVTLESRVTELETRLATSNDLVREKEGQIATQEETFAELTSQHQKAQRELNGMKEHLQEVQGELQQARTARESFEKELWNKMAEISSLGDQLEAKKTSVFEKESELAKQCSEIEQLKGVVQELRSSNEVLQSSIDGDKQTSAERLTQSLQQIQDLEERVTDLQSSLHEKSSEIDQLQQLNQKLHDNLQVSEERLQQRESSNQQELRELEISFGHEREETTEAVKKLEYKLQEKQIELDQLKESTKKELSERDKEIVEKQLSVEQLKKEVEMSEKNCLGFQSQLTKTSGALEFAQQELASRDGTIKTLSQTLDEKKMAIGRLEKELSQTKSENADRLTEVMQRSEQSLQSKVDLEAQLNEAREQLKRKEKEVKESSELLETIRQEKSISDDELLAVKGRLDTLLRESESTKVEAETLRGQVEDFSEIKDTLSRERTAFKNELTEVKSKLSQSSVQVSELQQKLKTAKHQLQKIVKEKQEESAKRESLETDLVSYKREISQMKEQFDSAVKLMESKSSEQVSAISRVQMELSQKEATCVSLQQQVVAENRKNNELKERVTKLSADYKVSLDRCRQLDQEKLQFQHRIAELAANHSQLEQSFSDALTERESLQSEHQASLRGMQEHEARVLDLTGQLAQLAREKQSMETQLREVSRQLVSTQQSNAQLSAEVGELKTQTHGADKWERERLIMLEAQADAERERGQLLANEEALKSQVEQLQSTTSRLQHELQESLRELDNSKRATSNQAMTADLQKQLGDLQIKHTSEVAKLQQSLQEETERRAAAQRSLEELRGEVAIGIDDTSLSGSPGSGVLEGEGNRPQNFMDYVNIASVWAQRLVKNPNIVLIRLFRATPQTKLFFLAYFVILHLLLLYIILT